MLKVNKLTLIKNGEVFSPEEIGNTDILICYDKVISIVKNIEVNVGSNIIDATDCYVCPGLIDQHAHYYWWGWPGWAIVEGTRVSGRRFLCRRHYYRG